MLNIILGHTSLFVISTGCLFRSTVNFDVPHHLILIFFKELKSCIPLSPLPKNIVLFLNIVVEIFGFFLLKVVKFWLYKLEQLPNRCFISFHSMDETFLFNDTCTKLLMVFFFYDQLKSTIWSWFFFFFIILLSMEVCKICWWTCFYLAVVFYKSGFKPPFCIYYYYFIINLIFSLQSMLCFPFHELLDIGDTYTSF